MRLQKYLASCGVASRRKCEAYILEGRVQVNSQVVVELGSKVTDQDVVTFDGKVIVETKGYEYYMLNKPTGYVTTVKDEKDRPIITDLMKDINTRIFPVGRLDYNTSGLLLLTNDGALTYALTHPKHHVKKTYRVEVKGPVDKVSVDQLCKGVVIDKKRTAPAEVKIIEKSNLATSLALTIHEGRNRQVRKMCEAIGHSVLKLRRVAIGDITLGNLAIGNYRKLTKEEINYLKKIGGIDV